MHFRVVKSVTLARAMFVCVCVCVCVCVWVGGLVGVYVCGCPVRRISLLRQNFLALTFTSYQPVCIHIPVEVAMGYTALPVLVHTLPGC